MPASTTTPADAPAEPPPSRWRLPEPEGADDDGVVGIGADLEPGTLLQAYRTGLFPMPVTDGRHELLAWWSPDPRAILPLGGMRVSRSLRRSMRRFELRFDTAFDDVVAACADPERPGRWITPAIAEAYGALHRLGWAHSVEAWDGDHLAGGLYGVAVGGLFAGESMFHHATDASKVALAGLVERWAGAGGVLIDVQWSTPHLQSLGVIDVPRAEYLARLADAVSRPGAWSGT